VSTARLPKRHGLILSLSSMNQQRLFNAVWCRLRAVDNITPIKALFGLSCSDVILANHDMKSETGVFHGLPVTMESVVRARARNNHVLLTGGTFAYHEIIMSFVCNLRRLGMYDELVIAAFDDELFEFGQRMGLSVFRYQHNLRLSAHALKYGQKNYDKMILLKPKLVLAVLNMGVDVTWTDTDIAYFKNPLPYLNAMESDFVIQTDAKETSSPNSKLCSGFYRIRSRPVTISAYKVSVVSSTCSSA
jgi:hypothetical protein